MPSEPMKPEISQSEEQLRSLVSSLDDFVFSIDREGKFLFYQPLQWSAYDTPALSDAFIGAAYKDVLPPEISAVLPGVIAEVTRSLSPHPIEYALNVEGKSRHYRGRVAPMFSPRFALIGYTFVASDVTAAVEAEARAARMLALERLNRQIAAIFFEDNDPETAIRGVLQKAGELLDVSSVSVFHFRENERRMDLIHDWHSPDSAAQNTPLRDFAFDELMPSLVPLLTRDGIIAARQLKELPDDIRTVFGGLGIVSLLLLPYHVNERLDGLIGVTEARQPREWLPEESAALRAAADGYARSLERQRAERLLITARDTALRSAQHKSEFLAKISHEIRTPMTALLGGIELMQETPLTDEQRELLVMAQKNAKRLMGMLVDVLDFSALEKGTVALESVPVDVRGILTEVEALWGEQARKKGLAFAVEIDERLPERVLSDPARLRQILINLTSNAVKFTESGTIQLRVKHLFSRNARARLRFEVSDTGIGIPPDKQAEIFESFIQADNTLARRYGGAGLGLSICKQLVLLMDGEIDVRSVEGDGSTFGFTATFHLPDTP